MYSGDSFSTLHLTIARSKVHIPLFTGPISFPNNFAPIFWSYPPVPETKYSRVLAVPTQECAFGTLIDLARCLVLRIALPKRRHRAAIIQASTTALCTLVFHLRIFHSPFVRAQMTLRSCNPITPALCTNQLCCKMGPNTCNIRGSLAKSIT